MTLKRWEKRVLASPGAPERVAEIETELRLSAGLTSLREDAGLSQRELAARIGVSQPRIAAIEQSRNVTLSVLSQYVAALGGELEIRVSKGGKTVPLLQGSPSKRVAKAAPTQSKPERRAARRPKKTKKAPAASTRRRAG